MKKAKKLLAFVLALTMVLGVMAGCTGNEDTTPSNQDTQAATGGTQAATDGTTAPVVEDGPQYGGHLDVGVCDYLNGLDPLKQTGSWKYIWTSCVWENPMTRDAEGNIAPGVCDYEISEDYLVLTLSVRDNMVFHNGDPVDLYDVEASINRALVLRSSMKSRVAPYIESMVVDEAANTLTITFTEYRDDCYYYLAAYQPWCAVMPKEICEKYPDSYITDTIADCIGTGPYYVSDFEDSIQTTLTKWEDYVSQESDRSGFAGTKYGYLDSMTYWQNMENSSRAMGLLSGDYDVVEQVTEDYLSMLEENNRTVTVYPNNSGIAIYFNTFGLNNVTAKYPSLRKAVMAAIDYETFASFVSDGKQVMGGQPVLSAAYETDAFETADYYGPTNLDAVSKYLTAAKEEGWDGTEPVVFYAADDGDALTLINDYLTKAGIPVTVATMESAALEEFRKDPSNVWDMYFAWPNFANAPTQLSEVVINTYWNSETKDALLAEMRNMIVDSDEYVAKWDELAQVWVDECAVAYMCLKGWTWYHDTELVTNDFDTVQRYMYNAYWTDPSAHMD